jgi:dihydroflavonol-4-reductase
VAGHLIQQLLQRGYRVRATLRDDVYAQSELFAYLSRLQMASELLEVVPLDLLTYSDDSTWKSAFEGVEYVMHVAGPVKLHDEDPENNIINPIVVGTQTILKYCQHTPTVKKLIYTSCFCAMTDVFEVGKKYDESCWNETATPTHSIYSYSKTTAEREVVRAAMSDTASFQVVSILPGTILGAHLGKKMSHSHQFFRNISMRNGKNKGILNISLAISDVRDVARFHIASMERESNEPAERFLCANIAMPMERILQIVHENFDDLVVPTRKVCDFVYHT